MPDTMNPSERDTLKKQLEGIASASANVDPQLSDGIQAVLTAANYADEALLESSLNSLLSCLADVARDIINRELKAWENIKEGIKKTFRTPEGIVGEDFDEVKDVIESLIDERGASMTKIRDKLVKILEEKDYEVENAQQLKEGIRDLRKFREDILKDWPSSSKQPTPINRKLVTEAREAIARGNKGMRKDELIWGNASSGPANEGS